MAEQVDLSAWLSKESVRPIGPGTYTRRLIKLDTAGNLTAADTEASQARWQINIRQYPVERGSRPLELVVTLPFGVKESYFAGSEEELEKWLTVIESANKLQFEDVYELGRMLGEGGFAKVYAGRRKHDDLGVAVKVIEKTDPDEIEYIFAECNIMKSISHPNVVQTYDVFDTPERLYLVMELMSGGELFDIIANAGKLSEQQAADIVRQLCFALAYLHELNIVHRDIKPENVLCTSAQWPVQIKICDFGFAASLKDGEVDEKGIIGTPGYVAPEMVNKEPYGPPIDMWGVGVLLYIMLSGKMPFYGRTDQECLKRIAHGTYSMPSREWAHISEDAKSLVRALLQVDPSKRLTAKTVLLHKWMETASDKPIANDLSGIHSSRRKLMKAVNITIMLQRLSGSLASMSVAPDAHAAAEKQDGTHNGKQG